MFIQQIEEGAVTRGIDFLGLGLFKWPETVVVALDLLHLHLLIEIESELEIALNNIVLHLAGNDSISASLELIPQIHLAPQLKFEVLGGGFLNVELFKGLFLVTQVE